MVNIVIQLILRFESYKLPNAPSIADHILDRRKFIH